MIPLQLYLSIFFPLCLMKAMLLQLDCRELAVSLYHFELLKKMQFEWNVSYIHAWIYYPVLGQSVVNNGTDSLHKDIVQH